jgi:hypothetical protein
MPPGRTTDLLDDKELNRLGNTPGTACGEDGEYCESYHPHTDTYALFKELVALVPMTSVVT